MRQMVLRAQDIESAVMYSVALATAVYKNITIYIVKVVCIIIIISIALTI